MAKNTPQIENPALPPYNQGASKPNFFKQLAGDIKWAVKNNGGNPAAAGMAAFLGIPMFHRNPGGDWMTYDPRNRSVYLKGTTPPVNRPPVTSGDDPTLQPPTEDNAYRWQFPQYSQSWAFTPPPPDPYLPLPVFDYKKLSGKK